MLNKNPNPLLAKTEQAIKAKIPPEAAQAAEKIVLAGVAIMDSEKTDHLVRAQLAQKLPPEEIAAQGVAKIMGILMARFKGTPPQKSIMPAAALLLLEALDRLEAMGRMKVDNKTLAEATRSLGSAMLQMMGVTPEKLNEVMQQARQQPSRPQQPPMQPAPDPGALIGAMQ